MWYKTGTVAVTNGSVTVTGTGTAFVGAVVAGHSFIGPDERTYEISAVVSATQITLARPYLGATASGQAYAIQPTREFNISLAEAASILISNFSTIAANAGAGRFGDGSLAAPGIRFAADENTGLMRPGAEQIAFVTNAIQRALLSATELQVNVPITGTATVTDGNDIAANRLLKTGAGPAQAFRRGNILGTVSQAAGVPTGAIIERGGNANGQFVRYADGTQICWNIPGPFTCTTAIGSMFENGANLTWTFPAAFSATPVAFGQGGDIYRGVSGFASTTVFTYRIRNPVSAANDVFAHLQAVGRWF